MAGTFRDLLIWQKGYELLMRIYDFTKKFPPEEKYNLTSQIQSSANAVIASIAEAHGRYHYADKVRVLYIGRGECEETQSHLSVALGRGYVNQKEFGETDSEYAGLGIGINRYIQSLISSKKKLD